jgi:hypothetical protein
MLQRGDLDPNVRHVWDPICWCTPLGRAFCQRQERVAKLLLAHKANVEAFCVKGGDYELTALGEALDDDLSTEMITCLLGD